MPSDLGSRPGFIHLSIQLHSSWPPTPTAFAASHGHFQGRPTDLGQEAMATSPARSPESSELSRCHLASLSPSLQHSQIKQKQNNTHVNTRGQGRGWQSVGMNKGRVPAPSVYPSRLPAPSVIHPSSHCLALHPRWSAQFFAGWVWDAGCGLMLLSPASCGGRQTAGLHLCHCPLVTAGRPDSSSWH